MSGVNISTSKTSIFSRRDFLIASSAAMASTILPGCVTNQATGRNQLILQSEYAEIGIDRKSYPQQLTQDYGIYQDPVASNYIKQLGVEMAAITHRPKMPYHFNITNNVSVNAYAFPGGATAYHRGIIVEMDDESELLAIIGHELGHVNARHTSEQVSMEMLQSAALGLAANNLGGVDKNVAHTIMNLSAIASTMLLKKFSRRDELEADALGMEYCNRVNINPAGTIRMHEKLAEMQPGRPDLLEMLMATHPMSVERAGKAVHLMETKYSSSKSMPKNRERFMDSMASVMRQKKSIKALQVGWSAKNRGHLNIAESSLVTAVKEAPQDYMGLVMLAEVENMMNKPKEALAIGGAAYKLNPSEPKAELVLGTSFFMLKQFDKAYHFFNKYDEARPGLPQPFFYKGLCLEATGNKREAAQIYYKYLTEYDSKSAMAQYAFERLNSWGLIKTEKKG